jgi:FSR family fosmidomycin resistance protein-like MFS transporter
METSLDKSALAGAPAGTGTGAATAAQPAAKVQRTVYSVLGAISFSHLLNDMIQSLILAIYPML